MPTRCRMPPESSVGFLCRASPRPTRLGSAPRSPPLARQVRERLRDRRASRSRRRSSRAAGRGTGTPRLDPAPGSVTSRPSSNDASQAGRVSPATIDSTVDLPQPEWPIRQTNSPSRMVRSKSSTTGSGRPGVGKALRQPGELQVAGIRAGSRGRGLTGRLVPDRGQALARGLHAAASRRAPAGSARPRPAPGGSPGPAGRPAPRCGWPGSVGRVAASCGRGARPRRRAPRGPAGGRSGAERNDAIGEQDGLVHVVGDQQDGLALGAPDPLDLVL